MVIVDFIRFFLSGDTDFFSIHYNDVIASVDIRSILGFVLPPKAVRDLCREPAEHFVGSVDNIPIAVDGFRGGSVGGHSDKQLEKRAAMLRTDSVSVNAGIMSSRLILYGNLSRYAP